MTAGPMSTDRRVGVIGLGTMGAGIVEVLACRGADVVAVDADAGAAQACLDRIGAALDKASASGRLDEPVASVLGRIAVESSLEAVGDRDVVIEAVIEDEAVKRSLFERLGTIVAASTMLATNTSSLPVTRLAAATHRPGRVVGLHFFNPVPRMPLVEVVSTPLAEDGLVERAVNFVEDVLGRRALVAPDRSGFVVNVLLVPYLLSAMRLHDNGVATATAIDDGMEGGCGMPMGPLRLADLIGLDTLLLVADCLYAEHRDPAFIAPPGFRRLVDAGWLGRKTGRGYHDYGAPPAQGR